MAFLGLLFERGVISWLVSFQPKLGLILDQSFDINLIISDWKHYVMLRILNKFLIHKNMSMPYYKMLQNYTQMLVHMKNKTEYPI